MSNYTGIPVRLVSGDFVSAAAGRDNHLALRRDTTILSWGLGTPGGNGFALGNTGFAGLDPDNDGLTTAQEWAIGSDPWNADTNGDGIPDGIDCFPLDPARYQCPPPQGGDTTPPTITLTEPTNAVLISSVP